MLEAINSVVTAINGVVWGWPMIILLFGTHLYMTFRTGFIQWKSVTKGIKLSVTKDPEAEGEVSQFGALTTALAATIGTGNIIGVGTAIALGGPGAVLWIWLTGVFGIATKYSESLIAVKYRVKTKDGRMQGGAMYALERGLNMRWLGLIFAFFGGFASFGIGCATQVNAIATVCNENFHIPRWLVGVVVAILTAIVIFGGIKAIANVCEKLVPFMAIFYVLGCIVILCMNYDYIIPALGVICRLAFTPGAAAGGLVGSGIMMALRFGVARGLFSNESGLGSAPIAAAAAQTRNPVRQALVSSTGWWCLDISCIWSDSGSWTDHSDTWYCFICIFYCSWMGILRRTLCRIFCREKSIITVSLPVCGSCSYRTGCSAGSCMADRRYIECADGDTKPCGSIVVVKCYHQ